MEMISLVYIVLGFLVGRSNGDCSIKYEPIGCFEDCFGDRAMPELLVYERTAANSTTGFVIDWLNYETYLTGLICRCSAAARNKGYSTIGIQFYGECWSGPDAHEDYQKHGVTDTCVDFKFKSFKRENLTSCNNAYTGVDYTNFVYRVAPTECCTMYEPIGCFKDNLVSPRPLPQLIVNERDNTHPAWNNKLIDWVNWKTYSPQMICRCADEAKLKLHDLFAIQFWGECWSGNSTSEYDRDGLSTSCYDNNFKKCSCNSYHCVGPSKVNYVYQLISG